MKNSSFHIKISLIEDKKKLKNLVKGIEKRISQKILKNNTKSLFCLFQKAVKQYLKIK